MPVRFVVFVLVGLFGMLVHLATLAFAFKVADVTFYYAQAIATLVAMTVNFNLNNELTYRDRRLRGAKLVRGQLSFIWSVPLERSRTFRSPTCCINCVCPGRWPAF
jgi:dolichol-phosphate mannosyltransferase